MSNKSKSSKKSIEVGSITKGIHGNVSAGQTIKKPAVSLKPRDTSKK